MTMIKILHRGIGIHGDSARVGSRALNPGRFHGIRHIQV